MEGSLFPVYVLYRRKLCIKPPCTGMYDWVCSGECVDEMAEKKHLTKVDGESIEGRVHNTYIYWNVVGGR